MIVAKLGTAEAMVRRYPLPHPKGFWVRWPQEAVTAVFLSLFPQQVFEGFKLPMIDDIVNAPPFSCYAEW